MRPWGADLGSTNSQDPRSGAIWGAAIFGNLGQMIGSSEYDQIAAKYQAQHDLLRQQGDRLLQEREVLARKLSKKYGVHPTQIGTWKRAAIENMATAFTRRGAAPEPVSAADVDKLHSKTGQLVVERDFLAEASHQLLGTRGKKW